EPRRFKMSAPFMLEKDAPFALRGIIGSTSSRYHTMRRFDRPIPTSEQLMAYKTITNLPHASSFPPSGTRALHSSRALSESAKPILNRPLSPHLPLKKPQLSATYSISHRIFGVGLATLILLPPLAMKFSLLSDI
ncbi:Succinate dehydrogenase subunit 3-2, mitochondrial, partial [Ananas comosus]